MQDQLCAPEGLTDAEALAYWRFLAHELYGALNVAIECYQNTGTLNDVAVDKVCRAIARAQREI
jgi:hypothetical protein